MSSIKETATHFFDACESGKGWDACSRYCHPDATFTVQADTFAELKTLEAYTNSMRDLIAGPVPDASYEITSFAVDDERGNVVGCGIFRGTNTGEGGPPPTGRTVETDYAYIMQFDGDRIRHMTKIWNDAWAMRQIGWA